MHVFAKIRGHGWELLPHYPYRFERTSEVNVRVVRRFEGRRLRADLDFTASPPRVRLAKGTPAVEDVVGLTPTPESGWRVVTGVFTCAWPLGLSVQAVEPGAPSSFDFLTAEDGLLYFQGPFSAQRLADPARLASPGQRVISSGDSAWGKLVELEYELEGVRWFQRHDLLPFGEGHGLVLSSQSPFSEREGLLGYVEALLPSVEPYVDPSDAAGTHEERDEGETADPAE